MVTLETALAAVVTFVLGISFGIWLVVFILQGAIRNPVVREYYRKIIDKAERHDLEGHDTP